MTEYLITSASTTLWHTGFGVGDPARLECTEIESFSIQHKPGAAELPCWLELSAPFPHAERLLDIDWAHTIEIHHQNFGPRDEYSRDSMYISIYVVEVEPMNIEVLSSPYPPEENSKATVLIRGYCTIHRKLKDND